MSIYQLVDQKAIKIKYYMMAWADPIAWLIDKSAKSILDVGCGLGVPMELIKYRIKVQYSVGVDLFKPYIDYLKKRRLHDKYVLVDIREMNFPLKSFDVVFASDVLEHLPKRDAWKLLKKMEKIAKKQVIVTTSLGYFFHPAVNNNKLQLHLSGYQPEELERRGYKVVKYGRKEILGEDGVVHKVKFDPFKKLIYFFNLLLFPFFFIFPNFGNYDIVAWKDIQ